MEKRKIFGTNTYRTINQTSKAIHDSEAKSVLLNRGIGIQFFATSDLKNQSSKSLKKGIRSFKKQIALHKEKGKNPAKYASGWESMDQREQEGMLKHWGKEIVVFQNSIQERITLLKERGDWDE